MSKYTREEPGTCYSILTLGLCRKNKPASAGIPGNRPLPSRESGLKICHDQQEDRGVVRQSERAGAVIGKASFPFEAGMTMLETTSAKATKWKGVMEKSSKEYSASACFCNLPSRVNAMSTGRRVTRGHSVRRSARLNPSAICESTIGKHCPKSHAIRRSLFFSSHYQSIGELSPTTSGLR